MLLTRQRYLSIRYVASTVKFFVPLFYKDDVRHLMEFGMSLGNHGKVAT